MERVSLSASDLAKWHFNPLEHRDHQGEWESGGHMFGMQMVHREGNWPTREERDREDQEWRSAHPASRGQLVYVRNNGKREPGEYRGLKDGKVQVALHSGVVEFDPADVDIWQPPHLNVPKPRGMTGGGRMLGRKSAKTPELSTVHRPLGTHGLWGDKTAQLPAYIQNIAHAMIRDGHDESSAIALAVAAVKRWAAGGNHVTPEVRSAAAGALAEWEKLRAEHAGKSFGTVTGQQHTNEYNNNASSRSVKFSAAELSAFIAKVGPHGYTHGWVFHGIPGSQDHAAFLSRSADDIQAAAGSSGFAKPVHDVLKNAAHAVSTGDIAGARKQLETAAKAVHQVAEQGEKPIGGMEHPARNVAFVLRYHADLLNGAQLTGRNQTLPDRPEAHATAQSLAHGLASGIAKEKAPGEGAMGETRMVTFNDGSKWVRKKDGMISQDREILSSRVSDAIGAGAPEVIPDPDWKPGDTEPTVWEPMLSGTPAVEKIAQGAGFDLRRYTTSPAGQKIGLLDRLISNQDRNNGNWLVNDEKPVPIDHGEAYFDSSYQPESEFSRGLSSSSFSPKEWNGMESGLSSLQSDFASLGHADWHEQMMNSFQQVRAS